MKVLFLGPLRHELIRFLKLNGCEVFQTEKDINNDNVLLADVDFIISYGYRYIIGPCVLEKFLKRIINLHISLLPWNRGADPNLWSFLEDTPKGVTIHYIDKGIDTGDILAQTRVDYLGDDTLRTSYIRLSERIESLFRNVWPSIQEGSIKACPQENNGSFHRAEDKNKYENLLDLGWDTPIANLIGKANANKVGE